MLTMHRTSDAGRRRSHAGRLGGSVALAALLLVAGGCDAFTSPDSRVERARERLSSGEYAPAMRELKLALESSPEHVEARLLLAKLSLQLGDGETAQKELDRALQSGADPASVTDLRYEVLAARGAFEQALADLEQERGLPEARRLELRGAALTSLRRFAEADEALRAAAQLAPEDARIEVERARNLALQGRDAEAHAAVRRALELDDSLARAWLLKGTLDFRMADFASAGDSFRKALDGGAAALTLPEQVGAEAGLVDVRLQLGDIEGAEQGLAALRRRVPDTAIVHYMAGRLQATRGNFAEALNELRRAVGLAPEHAPTRLLLATVLLSQGLLEQARAEVERVLQSDPADADARKLMAMVQLARNDPVAATKSLADVARADAGGDPFADRLMGAALVRAGSLEDGLIFLERSVAARPDDVDARLDLIEAYLVAGRPESARGLLAALPVERASERSRLLTVVANTSGLPRADAHASIEELVARDPRDAVMLRIAGAYLAADGEPGRGVELLRAATAAAPRDVNARLALASAESRAGNLDAVDRQLRAVLDVEPGNQRAHLGLARLALAQGDLPGATRRLEQAIGADPSAVEARLQLSRLAMAQNDPKRGRALLDQAAEAGANQPRVQNAVGEALLRSGDAEAALRRFTEAFAAGLPEAGINAARAQIALGRDPDARRTLADVLKIRTGWPPAVELLGILDVRAGRVEDALRRVEALRAAGVPAPLVDEMLGDVRVRAQQWAEADLAYGRAYAGESSARVALKRYAARRDGRLRASAQPLEDWLAREPRDAAVRRALAESLQAGGDLAGAAAEFERVLAAAPLDAVSLNNLAWVYHQRSDARAVETARRAFELAPAVPEIADTYGWLLVESGEVAKGLPILENAARVKGADPEIQYHLAAAYARSGQVDRAQGTLEPLLAGERSFPARQDAERLLASLRDRAPEAP
jgi:putative PEP-CTERM system TPR-repeat lipoprotein